MLVTQTSQVAQQQALSSVPLRSFLGHSEQNTKVHMNVVTTMSGNNVESYNDKSVEVKNNDPTPP